MKKPITIVIIVLSLSLITGCTTYQKSASVVSSGKLSSDPLDGLPFVTAKSWVIADGRTGEILWEYEGNKPAKAASTTKIMNTYVVLELAAENHSILDEIVTVSEYAANTKGSSAKLQEGDRIEVGELLYGLLLPSGNDAGNALAEHFHDRLDPPTVEQQNRNMLLMGDSRENFVAEMNRKAQSLGMTDTFYRIPYGDGGTDTEFITTARDLAELTYNAMQNSLFRKIVSTREYLGRLQNSDDSYREVTWENTNELLVIEGYNGVKTGTTKRAGACLVSSGWRGSDHLFIVVLGCSGSDARYVDTRNLYRWAWRERGHRR